MSQELQDLEKRIKELEAHGGSELVTVLMEYSLLLRQANRKLDAANAEARAKVLLKKQKDRASHALQATPNEVLPQASQAELPTEKPCPFCAEIIKAAAIKCRFCGSELSGTPTPSLSQEYRSSFRGMDICLSCGCVARGVVQDSNRGCAPGCLITILFLLISIAMPIFLVAIPIIWVVVLMSPSTSKPMVCSACKGNVIPADSPEGMRLITAKSRKSQT